MKYRKLGNSEVSVLGFGCMRFPTINNDNNQINEDLSIKLIRYGIDNGINYIDTAWPYHGGNSELLVGKALQDGYREKIHLATKLPSWLINSRSDMDKYLNMQLERLQTDHIDYYLLHTLESNFWDNYKKLDYKDFLESSKANGKIKNIGFSFHDELPLFKDIIDDFNWDFCQIQFNYMDENYQAGLKGLKYAAEKNIDVAVMEPNRGGSLIRNIPNGIKDIWSSMNRTKSPAGWSLNYIWDFPEVKTVLSGMNTFEQIDDNIKEASQSESSSLSLNELTNIYKVRDIYKTRTKIGCTGCQYCMPCPYGVDIPSTFELYNRGYMYNDIPSSKKTYLARPSTETAAACVKCGKCEELCPQHLPIRSLLEKVNKELLNK